MTRTYDLVIVGTGTAAMGVAMRVRAAGWRVAVIDFRPFGGTCMLRGCDPKKVLVAGAEAVDLVSRMRGHGVIGNCSINWLELMAFKRTFTDPVPEENKRQFAEKGIDAFTGKARFAGHNVFEVDGESLESRYFLIAAGAEPMRLGIPSEQYLANNEDFLSLTFERFGSSPENHTGSILEDGNNQARTDVFEFIVDSFCQPPQAARVACGEPAEFA